MKTSFVSRPRYRGLCTLPLCIAALWAMPRNAQAQLYVVQQPPGTVGEYGAATGAPNPNFIVIPALNIPEGLAVSGNTLFVANQGAPTAVNGTVGEYNATTGAAINANFITGLKAPNDLAVSSNTLFVANTGAGTVGAYDATTGATINASFIPNYDPVGLAVSGNTLFVSNFAGSVAGAGTVGAYDATTGAAINASLITGLDQPTYLAVSGNTLFVASFGTAGNAGTVGAYDATTGAVINANFITGLSYPYGLAVSGNNLRGDRRLRQHRQRHGGRIRCHHGRGDQRQLHHGAERTLGTRRRNVPDHCQRPFSTARRHGSEQY
jgi:hypothetical protein